MKDAFVRDLSALVQRGDTLLVHSSLSSLGGIYLGDVIEGMLEVLGEEGTLLFPALSYENVTEQTPVFDVSVTPSCVGYLPEYFRTRVPGVLRSVHPTHSCCAKGARAIEFTRDHHLDTTPVGPNSPFAKLRDAGGKILFIGCTSRPNTSMHGVEELVEPDYLYGDLCTYSIRDGKKTYEKTYKTHGFHNTEQRYDRLEALLTDFEIARGRVLQADCVLMDARAVWEKAQAMLRNDSHYFVDITE